MSRQYFGDVLGEPIGADHPTITAITETVLIPTVFTPIPAFEPRVGKIYELLVMGTVTTGTAGTLTLTPRFGTAIGGVALGASPAQNYVPSVTTVGFILRYYLTFRTIGGPGNNSSAVGYGSWQSNGAAATAASECSVYAGTVGAAVAIDTTVASALWMGVTFSVAPSVIPKFHMWRSLN